MSGVTFWIPFFFASLLSLLMLSNRESAWPAFYSFLPMAFVFTGGAFVALAQQIRRLEERIRTWEGEK